MACMRCGTCHSLMIGSQVSICKAANHEAPYDDEDGE